MTTRLTIKGKVLRIINKSSTYAGFHTDAHVNDVIQDAIDHIASQSFMAGEGWFKTIGYLDTVALVPTVTLPDGCVVIDDIRYKVNNTYISIPFGDGDNVPQDASGTALQQYPTYVRLVGNTLYFNPLPSEVGTSYIQIEYYGFPTELVADGTSLSAQFDRSMERYITWRAASQLMAMAGRPNRDWERYENEWLFNVQQVLAKRTRQTMYVGNFDG